MNIPDFKYQLHEHVGHISEILFFLLGAMTIVELVDNHKGFKIITDKITTNRRVKLLWILSIVAFFSAVLDNLTAAIVMGALLSKIMKEKNDLWFFGGMIIIAANAGGSLVSNWGCDNNYVMDKRKSNSS